MRKLAIAVALASTALATPAVARDDSFYVGLEGGLMVVEDMAIEVTPRDTGITFPYIADHRYGWDVDAIAGYDFGSVRVEAELGYKTAGVDEVRTTTEGFDADGEGTALSLMGNVLFEFGDDDGMTGYAGGGVGVANVKYDIDLDDLPPFGGVEFSDSHTRFAWQAILGVKWALGPNVDLGLKYRFFNVQRLRYETDSPALSTGQDITDFTTSDVTARFRSHSLLASLIYNFASAPPPPPPRRLRPAASAASGDADVPGRYGDPGDGRLPGSAASASAAAAGAGTRSVSTAKRNTGSGTSPGPVFFCAQRTRAFAVPRLRARS
ncbi:outer membrane beta-barrel protein [Sphingomonas lutea]|uniref:Outer membrane beta-barrel protein n=1 Tax=Sphingomonas lutea TaxID=1045317 RepID=A0A7G9SGP7_9SPHN|nr:outer membrane beta-barrel protein [Sphingomonas lutea]QNN67022.1 outer membrane beta-barrel protein [Sphingomonas lutea]